MDKGSLARPANATRVIMSISDEHAWFAQLDDSAPYMKLRCHKIPYSGNGQPIMHAYIPLSTLDSPEGKQILIELGKSMVTELDKGEMNG